MCPLPLPREHGSWVLFAGPALLGPLLAGALRPATLLAWAAGLALFLLREPLRTRARTPWIAALSVAAGPGRPAGRLVAHHRLARSGPRSGPVGLDHRLRPAADPVQARRAVGDRLRRSFHLSGQITVEFLKPRAARLPAKGRRQEPAQGHAPPVDEIHHRVYA